MKASVKFPANEPRQTRFGMRINVVLTTDDGQEVKLWGDENDATLKALRKGQTVEVFKDKKSNWQLSQESPFPAAQPLQPGDRTAPSTGDYFRSPDKQVRENMMKFITFQAKLYRHCFDEAAAVMENVNLPDGSVKDIATTLFLSTIRKYRLQ